MSGSKQTKIISKEDLKKSSPFAKYMMANLGYYFWDKKASKEVTKWEIHNTFTDKELEDVYNGIHKRYERKKK